MTFEEWCEESGYKHPEFGITISKTSYLLMQSAWNAAIASSLNAADAAFFKCPVGGDVSVDMRKSIEKLLTA